jgi:DNA-binding HxlR family transcriptional regulator
MDQMVYLCNLLGAVDPWAAERRVKGKRADFAGWVCPVARTLGVVGDPWSLLIVRDALGGKRRFGEFQKSLGLAKNILSDRLRKLVAEGVLEVQPSPEGGSRSCYVLTEKGELLKGVVVALARWGERFTIAPDEISPQGAGVGVAAESPRDERASNREV